MKPSIYSKIIYIVLFGFFASPFLLIGALAHPHRADGYRAGTQTGDK